jgi:glutamine synthetase
MQFLFFFAAILKGVYEHQDLLRISIAHAGNDHRLGANEAPPAIISAYVGDQLEDVIQQLLDGGLKESKQSGLLGLGSPVLPSLPKHAGDRNRTSPFAFTGNKFEFRAVGSSQSISFPIVVLNTIVADAIEKLCDTLEEKMDDSGSLEAALATLLKDTFSDIQDIVFNGDGYSEAWEKEAEKRGLLNLRTTMDALPKLTDEKNVELFEKHKVLNDREIHSRQEIWAEQYLTTINIEADTTESMAKTMIYPAAVRYMNELAENVEKVDGLGLATTGSSTMLNKVNDGLNDLNTALEKLRSEVLEIEDGTVIDRATKVKDNVIPAMNEIRDAVDFLERHTADDYWPLPVYREMLFVK